jgi:type II secretory pathway pseudopilin PulG
MDRKLRRAFTIIEVLIVTVLIVLILGVFMVRTSGVWEQQAMETARGDLRALQTAVNSYYLNTNEQYPDGANWQTGDLIDAAPKVLDSIRLDPFPQRTGGCAGWTTVVGRQYEYRLSQNQTYYVIYSYGPDRARGIMNIDNNGLLVGSIGDDIFVTNGTGTTV